jgi:hypothetical protein
MQESLTLVDIFKSIEGKLKGLSLTKEECNGLLSKFKQMLESAQVRLQIRNINTQFCYWFWQKLFMASNLIQPVM